MLWLTFRGSRKLSKPMAAQNNMLASASLITIGPTPSPTLEIQPLLLKPIASPLEIQGLPSHYSNSEFWLLIQNRDHWHNCCMGYLCKPFRKKRISKMLTGKDKSSAFWLIVYYSFIISPFSLWFQLFSHWHYACSQASAIYVYIYIYVCACVFMCWCSPTGWKSLWKISVRHDRIHKFWKDLWCKETPIFVYMEPAYVIKDHSATARDPSQLCLITVVSF